MLSKLETGFLVVLFLIGVSIGVSQAQEKCPACTKKDNPPGTCEVCPPCAMQICPECPEVSCPPCEKVYCPQPMCMCPAPVIEAVPAFRS